MVRFVKGGVAFLLSVELDGPTGPLTSATVETITDRGCSPLVQTTPSDQPGAETPVPPFHPVAREPQTGRSSLTAASKTL